MTLDTIRHISVGSLSGFSTGVATTESEKEEKKETASTQRQEEHRSIVKEIITENLRLGQTQEGLVDARGGLRD